MQEEVMISPLFRVCVSLEKALKMYDLSMLLPKEGFNLVIFF